MTVEQINNTFTYHKPIGDQQQRYEQIRSDAKVLALTIQECCPESREKSLALTNLQQSVMWANASIAINERKILKLTDEEIRLLRSFRRFKATAKKAGEVFKWQTAPLEAAVLVLETGEAVHIVDPQDVSGR